MSALNLIYSVVAIAKLFARPVRVYLITQIVEKGRFARVCVEMDLSKLVPKVV